MWDFHFLSYSEISKCKDMVMTVCFEASFSTNSFTLTSPLIPPFLEGPSAKWNLAEDDSFPIISCSFLSLRSSISSQYQLSLAKENKSAISFACFCPNINTLFPPPSSYCVFFLLFLKKILLTFSCGELEDVNRAISTCSLSSSPHHSALRLLFFAISASLGVFVSFGNRSCSASDSADSLARVEIMWKKTDCKAD